MPTAVGGKETSKTQKGAGDGETSNLSDHRLYLGDTLNILQSLPPESVQCVVTSPPYYRLRDYHVDGQIGQEATPDLYVDRLVEVFGEVRRVLRRDGTLWLNLGDSYSSSRPKDLLGIPWRVALALQADGWILRSDIVWAKSNAMPESVGDRPTRSHEFLFLFSRNERYRYNAAAIAEPCTVGDAGSRFDAGKSGHHANQGRDKRDKQRLSGNPTYAGFNDRWAASPTTRRNKRDVWSIPTQPFAEAHFAVFPEQLVDLCIRAGCEEGQTVLDPFGGSGTVTLVAQRLHRRSVYIDINPEYVRMAERRCFRQTDLGGSSYSLTTGMQGQSIPRSQPDLSQEADRGR